MWKGKVNILKSKSVYKNDFNYVNKIFMREDDFKLKPTSLTFDHFDISKSKKLFITSYLYTVSSLSNLERLTSSSSQM